MNQPFLMKSCETQFKLDMADTLRFGTLSYFRMHKDPEIGDDAESAFEFKIDTSGMHNFSRQLIQGAFLRVVNFGVKVPVLFRPCSFSHEEIEFGPGTADRVSLRIKGLNFRTEGSDAFIFCMSQVDRAHEAPRVGYADQWKIDVKNAEAFAKIAVEQFNSLRRRDWRKYLPDDSKCELYQNARFQISFGSVTYQPRLVWLFNPNDGEMYQLVRSLQNSDFLKEDRYSHQAEFRFCVRLVAEGGILPLNSSLVFLDLDAAPFRRFLVKQA